MADQMVKFVSTTELNARKDEKRRAREQILDKAKADYEREERRRAKRKETGQDTWMLPSLSNSLSNRITDDHPKKKKRKKERKNKEKKSKKIKKKLKEEKESSSGSDSSDEWVVKGAENLEDVKNESDEKKKAATQRESWMLFPCFSGIPAIQPKKGELKAIKEEEEKKVSVLDLAGQHSRELNPYWKDGGVGLPTTHQPDGIKKPSGTSTTYDVKWLKKSLQRSIEQAEEEGRSLEDIVADRWGSLEHLRTTIAEAEKRSCEEPWESKRKWERDRREERPWNRQSDNNRNRREDKARDRGERHRYGDYSKDLYHDKRSGDKYSNEGQERDTATKREHDRLDYRDRRDKNRDCEDDSSEGRGKVDDNCHSRSSRNNIPSSTDKNVFRRPDTTSASPLSSLKFMKPIEETSKASTDPHRTTWKDRGTKYGQSSGGWKKNNPKTNRIEEALKRRKENIKEDIEQSSNSDSSESEVNEKQSETNTDNKNQSPKQDETVTVEPAVPCVEPDVPCVEPAVPIKKITEADLNNMGAKILRAELMGNEDLASELKATLEQMRKDKETQECCASSRKETREEEVVVLTRTDKFGNTRPVNMSQDSESQRGRRKKEKVATHDKSGQRERYFADDDRHDLKEMVRREKMNTAEDYDTMFSRLASKAATKTDSDDFTLDDHFVTGAATKLSKAKEEERERTRAIREHQHLSEQLSKCRFCFENPDLAKHLIIAIGIQVYLALPLHTSLTEGHCLILPMQHQVASTYLDEDVVDEIKVFKKGLTRMFLDMDKDVVFLETCRNLARQNHMVMECIPLPKEEGDLAPMYFKKAILESESEWAQNKKLVDTRAKGLRGSVPKGLPYFSVEFGLDGGYAHVIEEEHAFPHYFGKEIIGGMLDLEPRAWHKPRRENFEQHKTKVLQFADWWKPYDWTKRLDKNQ